MQSKNFEIQGYFEHADFEGDFKSVKELLLANTTWAISVLEGTDVKPRIVEYIRKFSLRDRSKIKTQKDNSIIAVGPIGKKQCLAYKINANGDAGVTITPIAFLAVKYKIGISIMLTLAYIVPVLLSPLVWRKYAQNNLKLSRYYLTSFCHYLEDRLG
jgi:hypothetical protein